MQKPRESGAFCWWLSEFLMRGDSGVYEWLAVGTFAATNVIIGAIFIGTVWLLVKGKLELIAPGTFGHLVVRHSGGQQN